jgi:hypothetical protein
MKHTRPDRPQDSWERAAPWVAPLLTVAVFALATFVMYTNCGAAVI